VTKQVQLRDASYERLKGLKQPGESFSDVVDRLTGKRPSLLGLADLSTPEDAAEADRVRKAIDAHSKKREADKAGHRGRP
jgi:predicted CopG family antitoxin